MIFKNDPFIFHDHKTFLIHVFVALCYVILFILFRVSKYTLGVIISRYIELNYRGRWNVVLFNLSLYATNDKYAVSSLIRVSGLKLTMTVLYIINIR